MVVMEWGAGHVFILTRPENFRALTPLLFASGTPSLNIARRAADLECGAI
jgi:hypothetical protein